MATTNGMASDSSALPTKASMMDNMNIKLAHPFPAMNPNMDTSLMRQTQLLSKVQPLLINNAPTNQLNLNLVRNVNQSDFSRVGLMNNELF